MKTSTCGQSRWEFLYLIVSIVIIRLHVKRSTTKAKNLVKVGQQIEAEYGIPIANKRVTVTPISLIAAASQDHDYVKSLDRAAKTLGIDFIGGYSALVQ